MKSVIDKGDDRAEFVKNISNEVFVYCYVIVVLCYATGLHGSAHERDDTCC